MKIFSNFKLFLKLVPLAALISLISCHNPSHDEILQRLINQGLKSGPHTKNAFLNIQFGESRIQYQKKLDSLYKVGKIKALVPDSTLHQIENPKFFKYYYQFPSTEMSSTGKWLLSPAFENNRLVALALINTPILDKELSRNINGLSRGLLKEIINTSKEVMDEADITYRLTKNYLTPIYGKPDYVINEEKKAYWVDGNLQISLKLNVVTVEVLFKNS